jgi:hypothetical protein
MGERVIYKRRTLRLGVREHRCRMRETRLDAPPSSDRTRSRADVATNGDVSAEGKRTDRIFAVEDDHKICDIRADLKTPADTTCRNAGWGGP